MHAPTRSGTRSRASIPTAASAPRGVPFAEYAADGRCGGPAIGIAPLIGHITLKVAAGGSELARPTPDERDAMVRLLEESFEAGAVGLSTGLDVPAGDVGGLRRSWSRLGEPGARHDRLFAVHMRNYNDRLLEARWRRRSPWLAPPAAGSRSRTSRSPGSATGARSRRRSSSSIAARAEASTSATDIYPYIAGSANLSQVLPESAQAGGDAGHLRARLGEGTCVRRDRRRTGETSRFIGWDEVQLALVDSGHGGVARGDRSRRSAGAAAWTRRSAVLDLIRRHRRTG